MTKDEARPRIRALHRSCSIAPGRGVFEIAEQHETRTHGGIRHYGSAVPGPRALPSFARSNRAGSRLGPVDQVQKTALQSSAGHALVSADILSCLECCVGRPGHGEFPPSTTGHG